MSGTMAGPFASTHAIASCAARDALLGRELLQRLDQPLIALAVLTGEARQVRTEIAAPTPASSRSAVRATARRRR